MIRTYDFTKLWSISLDDVSKVERVYLLVTAFLLFPLLSGMCIGYILKRARSDKNR
jgi:uncharacterized membrane protein AbrB (regulator of aidB expression)